MLLDVLFLKIAEIYENLQVLFAQKIVSLTIPANATKLTV